MSISVGLVVKSLSGRDKDLYFVVVRLENGFVYVSDGKLRKLENPKKKNIKHLALTEKMIDITEMTNKRLRKLMSEINVSTKS